MEYKYSERNTPSNIQDPMTIILIKYAEIIIRDNIKPSTEIRTIHYTGDR